MIDMCRLVVFRQQSITFQVGGLVPTASACVMLMLVLVVVVIVVVVASEPSAIRYPYTYPPMIYTNNQAWGVYPTQLQPADQLGNLQPLPDHQLLPDPLLDSAQQQQQQVEMTRAAEQMPPQSQSQSGHTIPW
jgi:hypothetical protein